MGLFWRGKVSFGLFCLSLVVFSAREGLFAYDCSARLAEVGQKLKAHINEAPHEEGVGDKLLEEIEALGSDADTYNDEFLEGLVLVLPWVLFSSEDAQNFAKLWDIILKQEVNFINEVLVSSKVLEITELPKGIRALNRAFKRGFGEEDAASYYWPLMMSVEGQPQTLDRVVASDQKRQEVFQSIHQLYSHFREHYWLHADLETSHYSPKDQFQHDLFKSWDRDQTRRARFFLLMLANLMDQWREHPSEELQAFAKTYRERMESLRSYWQLQSPEDIELVDDEDWQMLALFEFLVSPFEQHEDQGLEALKHLLAEGDGNTGPITEELWDRMLIAPEETLYDQFTPIQFAYFIGKFEWAQYLDYRLNQSRAYPF